MTARTALRVSAKASTPDRAKPSTRPRVFFNGFAGLRRGTPLASNLLRASRPVREFLDNPRPTRRVAFERLGRSDTGSTVAPSNGRRNEKTGLR